MKQRWSKVLVSALVPALALGIAWTIRAEGGAGGTHAAPASVAPLLITARGRYPPTPDSEMATTQKNNELLGDRYREYQQRWQAYQVQLLRCQKIIPSACGQGSSRDHCVESRLVPCLVSVLAPLDTARHAVHDQAIELEEAAQQLAGKTQ